MQITEMTQEHVPMVSALEAAAFSTPWSGDAVRGELENPWAIWLVAMDGEHLLGYLGVHYGPDGGDIMTIATEPACLRQGVAKTLILAMISRLRELGLGYLTLEVRPSNAPALALYHSLGFQQVGRRPGYYQKPKEDALLLTCYFG